MLERIGRVLASDRSVRLVFYQIKPDRNWGSNLLFSYSMYEVGAQGVLDDGSDLLVWPFALLLNDIALTNMQLERGVGVFPAISVEEPPPLPWF